MPRNADGRCEAGVRLAAVAGRWKPPVIDALRAGASHYLALLRTVEGVSRRMLTQTLRELERDGLVDRTPPAQPYGKVLYELTDAGRASLAWLDRLVADAPPGDAGPAPTLDDAGSSRRASVQRRSGRPSG